jgi:hypothetical protein
MNARSFIVRALLFALVLTPSAMRMSARQLGVPSCRVAKSQSHVSPASETISGGSLDQLLAFTPRHHAPAPRLHRIRGKKINAERGFVLAPPRNTSTHCILAEARVLQQEMGGPNPSRGPPSQNSL